MVLQLNVRRHDHRRRPQAGDPLQSVPDRVADRHLQEEEVEVSNQANGRKKEEKIGGKGPLRQ